MALRESLLMEMQFEAESTRETLRRVPADRLDWQPHAKSATMGWLAAHLANIATWGAMTLASTELDLASPEMHQRTAIPDTPAEILANFETNLAAFRDALSAATDEQLLTPWTLRAGEKTFFTMPRVGVLRMMIFSHAVHHRAQLGVYLRLNDVPVPSIYGPSADESSM
jgi:uncharacterized damage-inducible protein DinB